MDAAAPETETRRASFNNDIKRMVRDYILKKVGRVSTHEYCIRYNALTGEHV